MKHCIDLWKREHTRFPLAAIEPAFCLEPIVRLPTLTLQRARAVYGIKISIQGFLNDLPFSPANPKCKVKILECRMLNADAADALEEMLPTWIQNTGSKTMDVV
mmetsp:Transcript_54285/g.65301  ORF Transcript_54285/g.65301 Transcript_54285/m.65301 type:complete len:104 (-) Transcript_54285:208-519(-)